ncbi:MAG TPA: hypothetical protein VNP72_07775, partial [Longimicrobium sp.]|nr:hypothetical protein [Longimicrobium sp.]
TLVLLYNLMWSSQRMLNVGQPDSALPFQYEALRMIQELNKSERIYPRGNVSVDPIDVPAARGEGKMDEVDPAGRGAGPALPSVLPLLASLDRAAANLGRKPPREASLEISTLAALALADAAADRDAAALISRAAGEAAAGRPDRARDLLRRARARLAPAASATARPLPSTADPAAADYFRRLGRTQP